VDFFMAARGVPRHYRDALLGAAENLAAQLAGGGGADPDLADDDHDDDEVDELADDDLADDDLADEDSGEDDEDLVRASAALRGLPPPPPRTRSAA
jgi:hypothetical protein